MPLSESTVLEKGPWRPTFIPNNIELHNEPQKLPVAMFAVLLSEEPCYSLLPYHNAANPSRWLVLFSIAGDATWC